LWVGKQQLHSEIRCVRQFVNPSKLEFREVSSWLFQRLRREQPTLRHCGPADSLDYREELWLGPVVWGQSSKEATVYFGSRFRSLVRPRISRVVVVGSGDGTSRPYPRVETNVSTANSWRTLQVTVLVLLALAAGAAEGGAQVNCHPVEYHVGQDWIAKGGSRGSVRSACARPSTLSTISYVC
jgi:hypothetical protein